MQGQNSLEKQLASKKKLYFMHPKNKFWEVYSNGQNVKYRAGKIKNQEQCKVQMVQKSYNSQNIAKKTVLQKIKQKLIKGYIIFYKNKPQTYKTQISQQISININQNSQNLKDGTYLTQIQQKKQFSKQEQNIKKKGKTSQNSTNKEEKKKLKSILSQIDEKQKERSLNLEQSKRQNNQQSFSCNQKYKGVKMIKQKLEVMYEIANNKIRITKFVDESSCGFQIKSFNTNQEAVNFVKGEEEWFKGEDYVYQQFKSTFQIEEKANKPQNRQNQKTKTKKSGSKSKQVALIDKTDEALVPFTNQLYLDNSANIYKEQPRLGPPASGMSIKLLLAESWKEGADPKGWLISQKLDGVRCFWTGTQMYSRNGNKFYFPNFFTRNWPKCQLDGQLFIGRGLFSHTISAVKKQNPVNFQWEKVRYLVFDAPGLNKIPFKQRYKILKQIIVKLDNPYIKCHYHRQCKGFPDLFHQLELVNNKQGEGLMLRDPQSIYQFKRSKALLKVKTFHDDQAQIVGYNQGTGRFVGHVGSLKVVNKLGINFDVGSGLNDEMRLDPPKVGTRIVFKYQQINKDTGRPRFPTFLRIFQDQTKK